MLGKEKESLLDRRGKVGIRRLSCRQAKQRASCLTPCASLQACLRRIVRSLCKLEVQVSQSDSSEHYPPFSTLIQMNSRVLTTNEQRVPREYGFLLAVLYIPANTVLRMTRRVQRFHQNVITDFKGRVIVGRASYAITVFAANNGNIGVLSKLQNLGQGCNWEKNR